MYKVSFDKEVLKFLQKHKWESVILQFKENIEILKSHPVKNNLDIKSLRWLEGHYRMRIWKYRFLYFILDNNITIYFYKAGSRGDIYKN